MCQDPNNKAPTTPTTPGAPGTPDNKDKIHGVWQYVGNKPTHP
jgi:hypothetical protein